MLGKLGSGHAADDGVHPPVTRDLSTGDGQAGGTLGQRGLHTLTLHLLHPVAFLTDQRPQSGSREERQRAERRWMLGGCFSSSPLKQPLRVLPGGGIRQL